jgi:hypothetical protein
MWRFKESEEKEGGICRAAAGFIFVASQVSKRKRGVFGFGQH